MSGGLVGVNLRGGLVGQDPFASLLRRVPIDDDGDGYTHIVSGSDVTSFNVTGLDAYTGAAGYVRMVGQIYIVASGTSTVNYRAQPNGVTAGTSNQLITGVGGTAGATTVSNDGFYIIGEVNVLRTYCEFSIQDLSSLRTWVAQSGGQISGPAIGREALVHGYCTSTTQLSSLNIVGNIASELKIGSWLRLFAEYNR